MSKAKVIKDYRLMSLLIAAMASLALVLSGCGTTSAKQRDDSEVVEIDPGTAADSSDKASEEASNDAPADAPKRDSHFGSMEVGENIDGSMPDGQTLLGPDKASNSSYSYGNQARTVDYKHDATGAYDCMELNALYERDWETNMSILGDAGYTVEAICELSLDQVEMTLAYESGLFDDIDTSDEYSTKGYGGTIYNVSDSDGFYYYVFVPSWGLVHDYGQDGVFTADYIFCYQENPDGGPVELYYNLMPDEAHEVFYG